jgi:hypothetical protein
MAWRTLQDALDAGEALPLEVEPIEASGPTSSRLVRCNCSRVYPANSLVDTKPPGLPVADRIPGRIRRQSVRAYRRARRRGLSDAQVTAILDPDELSPRYACPGCMDHVRPHFTEDELTRRLGGAR